MTETEYIVIRFLEASPETYYGRREIARKAVKRTLYEENPNWADAALASLRARGLIEENDSGQYRYQRSDICG